MKTSLRLVPTLPVVVLTAQLALVGCATGPDYKAPSVQLPVSFRNAPSSNPTASASMGSLETWWKQFQDPTLTLLVERVVSRNLDLQQAAARVDQSHWLAVSAGAALLPSGLLRLSDSEVKQSLLDPTTIVSRHSPEFERTFNQEQVGFLASWELDLFGGLRRAREASRADAEVAASSADALRVSVTAEAVDAYVQLRGQQGRLLVARQQEANALQLLELITQRAREGLAAERELHQTRALLARIRGVAPFFEADIETQLERLNVLCGGLSATERDVLAAPSPLLELPVVPLDARPEGLLRHRPDVITAEHRIAAASARIGSAISEYYPKVSLSALLGYSSIESGQLFSGDANQRQLGLGLRWRLFDFGRVDAEVAVARGREAEAMLAYRAAILKATSEVETSLAQLEKQVRRSGWLKSEHEELSLARTRAVEAYGGGAISLIEVLEADRQLLGTSDDIVITSTSSARASVALFRALGGGWQPAAQH